MPENQENDRLEEVNPYTNNKERRLKQNVQTIILDS